MSNYLCQPATSSHPLSPMEYRPIPSWDHVFEDAKPELQTIANSLDDEKFFPDKQDIFRAFELTPLNSVRVVIIGQDPYPQLAQPRAGSLRVPMPSGRGHPQLAQSGRPRATGLAFSVARDDTIPASLRNIFHELKSEYPNYQIPQHGDLTEWAQHGVLLINSSLTVRPYHPGSNRTLWTKFLAKILNALTICRPNTIYLLMGKEAQKLEKYIDPNGVVLESAHPSVGGSWGPNVFKEINSILQSRGETPIDWQIHD